MSNHINLPGMELSYKSSNRINCLATLKGFIA